MLLKSNSESDSEEEEGVEVGSECWGWAEKERRRRRRRRRGGDRGVVGLEERSLRERRDFILEMLESEHQEGFGV